MENFNESKKVENTIAAGNMKEESAADIPADDIEENRDSDADSEVDSNSSSDSSSSDSDSEYEFECNVCNKTFSGYQSFRQHQKGKKHAKAVSRKKKEKKLLTVDTANENDEELLLQEPYAKCKFCNKEFYGPESYQQHFKSKKHKQKVLEASILEQVQEEGGINVEKLQDLYKSKLRTNDALEQSKEKMMSLTLEDEDEKSEEFECKQCEKVFSGLIPFTQHLLSKSHAKKVEKNNLLDKVIPGTSKEDDASEKSKQKDVNTLSIEDDILVCKACSTAFSGPGNAMTHMKSKKHAKKLEKYIRKLEKKKEKERTKSNVLSSDEKAEIKPENEEQDEKSKEKLEPSSDKSAEFEESDKNNAMQSSSTDNQNKGVLTSYEKYKEYKSLMNSVLEDEL